MTDTYTITDEQWQQINNALLAAIGITSVHAKECHQQMLDASNLMDEIVNGPDDAEDEAE